jgi:hypothetical protein
MPRFVDVDPRTLYLPPSLWGGADPGKFTRQLSRFGRSTVGMDPPEVVEDPDGRLMVMNGVTRATRVARFLPGQLMTVEITDTYPRSVAHHPTVGDRLP